MRRSVLADEHDPAIAIQRAFVFDVRAEHQRRVLQRSAFARLDGSALKNCNAADADERYEQLGDRRRARYGARGSACESLAHMRIVTGDFGAFDNDVAVQCERGQRLLEKYRLFARCLDHRNRNASRNCDRNRRQAGAGSDVDQALAGVRRDGKTVDDVRHQFAGAFRTGEIERTIGFEHERAIACQRRNDTRVGAGGEQQALELAGYRATVSRARCTNKLKIAASAGVTPGMRPAEPSVRGRCADSFSRASRESATISE